MIIQVRLNEIHEPDFLLRIRLSTFQTLQAENRLLSHNWLRPFFGIHITSLILNKYSSFFNHLGPACLALADTGKFIKT